MTGAGDAHLPNEFEERCTARHEPTVHLPGKDEDLKRFLNARYDCRRFEYACRWAAPEFLPALLGRSEAQTMTKFTLLLFPAVSGS
jgi:hypothetical protein